MKFLLTQFRAGSCPSTKAPSWILLSLQHQKQSSTWTPTVWRDKVPYHSHYWLFIRAKPDYLKAEWAVLLTVCHGNEIINIGVPQPPAARAQCRHNVQCRRIHLFVWSLPGGQVATGNFRMHSLLATQYLFCGWVFSRSFFSLTRHWGRPSGLSETILSSLLSSLSLSSWAAPLPPPLSKLICSYNSTQT